MIRECNWHDIQLSWTKTLPVHKASTSSPKLWSSKRVFRLGTRSKMIFIFFKIQRMIQFWNKGTKHGAKSGQRTLKTSSARQNISTVLPSWKYNPVATRNILIPLEPNSNEFHELLSIYQIFRFWTKSPIFQQIKRKHLLHCNHQCSYCKAHKLVLKTHIWIFLQQ